MPLNYWKLMKYEKRLKKRKRKLWIYLHCPIEELARIQKENELGRSFPLKS